METSLHRQLKQRYARSEDDIEVVVDGFRIDAINADGELIEIQHASLGALRRKTEQLLASSDHRLRIVKPLVARKRVTTIVKRTGKVVRTRMSPKRGEFLDIFVDLVHFATVFPMERLTLEVLLVDSEEIRLDRKEVSRRRKRYHLIDQKLTSVLESHSLQTLTDLTNYLPLQNLPAPFDTAELAAAMERPRWFAQKVAYCLRTMGAIRIAGKRRNAQLYSAVVAQTVVVDLAEPVAVEPHAATKRRKRANKSAA